MSGGQPLIRLVEDDSVPEGMVIIGDSLARYELMREWRIQQHIHDRCMSRDELIRRMVTVIGV